MDEWINLDTPFLYEIDSYMEFMIVEKIMIKQYNFTSYFGKLYTYEVDNHVPNFKHYAVIEFSMSQEGMYETDENGKEINQ